MPSRDASFGLWMCTTSPSKRISPESTGWIPAMHLMSVDLPAPLSPTRAMTSPAATRKSTWYSAWTAPNRFETPRSSRTGWLSVIGSDPCLRAEIRVLAGADVLLLEEPVLERHVDVVLRDRDGVEQHRRDLAAAVVGLAVDQTGRGLRALGQRDRQLGRRVGL